MTKGSWEYYENQINKVDPDCVGVKIQLRAEGAQTNWLDINSSSAQVMIDYLNRFLEGLDK